MKRRGKITLLGMGLLGGSLGLAIQSRKLADRVVGYVRNEVRVKEYAPLGVADEITCDLASAVRGADWIVLCVPVEEMGGLLESALPYIQSEAIITDVGSVKHRVEEDLSPIAKKAGAWFVGSHPMAGSEKTGPQNARVDLFKGATCVVTPSNAHPDSIREQVKLFWEALGCRVVELAPKMHDRLVSRASHLPHVVSAALVNYVLSPSHPDLNDQTRLCSTGFKDATRIASGAPGMWKEIAMANREELISSLAVLIEDLKDFQDALRQEESTTVLQFFEMAKELRDRWLETDGRFRPQDPGA